MKWITLLFQEGIFGEAAFRFGEVIVFKGKVGFEDCWWRLIRNIFMEVGGMCCGKNRCFWGDEILILRILWVLQFWVYKVRELMGVRLPNKNVWDRNLRRHYKDSYKPTRIQWNGTSSKWASSYKKDDYHQIFWHLQLSQLRLLPYIHIFSNLPAIWPNSPFSPTFF